MVIATLALIGLLIATYLWLWKIGVVGHIICGSGGCEVVQTSTYATFLGLPVALIGVVGYLTLLIVSLVGIQPRWIDHPGPTRLMAVLSGLGAAFAIYLTYLEYAVIEAWCRWCVGSAVIICAIFLTAILGMRGAKRTG